jgi:hypothetical protein
MDLQGKYIRMYACMHACMCMCVFTCVNYGSVCMVKRVGKLTMACVQEQGGNLERNGEGWRGD